MSIYTYVVAYKGAPITAYGRKKDLLAEFDRRFEFNGAGYQFFRIRHGERAVEITEELHER